MNGVIRQRNQTPNSLNPQIRFMDYESDPSFDRSDPLMNTELAQSSNPFHGLRIRYPSFDRSGSFDEHRTRRILKSVSWITNRILPLIDRSVPSVMIDNNVETQSNNGNVSYSVWYNHANFYYDGCKICKKQPDIQIEDDGKKLYNCEKCKQQMDEAVKRVMQIYFLKIDEQIFAFKIEISEYNLERKYKLYTISKLTQDPNIVSQLQKKMNVDQTGNSQEMQPISVDKATEDNVNLKDLDDVSVTPGGRNTSNLKRNVIDVYSDDDEVPGQSATKPRTPKVGIDKPPGNQHLLTPKVEK